MDMRVESDNGKANEILSTSKVWRFSNNEYWKNIGCLILDPIFGVGGVDNVRNRRGED